MVLNHLLAARKTIVRVKMAHCLSTITKDLRLDAPKSISLSRLSPSRRLQIAF